MSIEHAERVTMQATPLNNPAGIPNDRDTADPRVIPGPDHDTCRAYSLRRLNEDEDAMEAWTSSATSCGATQGT